MLIQIAQKNGFDALNTMQKTSSVQSTISEKSALNAHFDPFWPFLTISSWDFLRCIHCIKTLLLSYWSQHSDIYYSSDFSLYGGCFIMLGWSKVIKSGKNNCKRRNKSERLDKMEQENWWWKFQHHKWCFGDTLQYSKGCSTNRCNSQEYLK